MIKCSCDRDIPIPVKNYITRYKYQCMCGKLYDLFLFNGKIIDPRMKENEYIQTFKIS